MAGRQSKRINNGESKTAAADDERLAMLDQAERCRRLAREHYDREITSRLEALAMTFEKTAAELARKHG